MKKPIFVSLIMSTFLLTAGGATIYANSGVEGVIIGYNADRNEMKMEVTGPKQVIRGTNEQTYHALLEDTQAQVHWRVEGATSNHTKIDVRGSLSIGVDEKADVLEIVACVADYPSKFASMKVELVEKTYTITSIEKKADITMKYGTTQEQLKERLQEYNTFQVTIKTNEEKTYVISVNRAKYHTDENIIDKFGILKSGDFNVFYELIIPYISINYDDMISLDSEKSTNAIGETNTDIKVKILENENKGNTPSYDEPTGTNINNNNSLNGSIHPNTKDETHANLYTLTSIMALALLIFIVYKRRIEIEQNTSFL